MNDPDIETQVMRAFQGHVFEHVGLKDYRGEPHYICINCGTFKPTFDSYHPNYRQCPPDLTVKWAWRGTWCDAREWLAIENFRLTNGMSVRP